MYPSRIHLERSHCLCRNEVTDRDDRVSARVSRTPRLEAATFVGVVASARCQREDVMQRLHPRCRRPRGWVLGGTVYNVGGPPPQVAGESEGVFAGPESPGSPAMHHDALYAVR